MGKKLKTGYNTLAEEFGVNELTSCIGYNCRTIVSFNPPKGTDVLIMKSWFQQELIKRGVLWTAYHALSYMHKEKEINHTLNAFYDIGEEASYPFIVETIYEAKGQLLIMAERIAMKIGPPILDYVLDFIEQSDTELENHFRFKKLLDHIGIDSVQDRMDAQSDRYSFLYS